MSPPESVRVFLSYSWDSPEHKERVLTLVQRLRGDGVDAWIDRFTVFPEEGWPRWMANEIARAAFVLIVATERYATRFAGHDNAGVGLGATWEGAIITQDLYEAGRRNKKFVPVVFSVEEAVQVPQPLRSSTWFRVDTEDGYLALYRLITGQPEIVPSPLGAVRDLPGGAHVSAQPALPIPAIHNHAAARSNLPRLPYGFFGREKELAKVADALEPEARTWGVLIDGPGGIGKTALAIRTAELTPPGQFRRVLFLSAKERELTSDGERELTNFVVPAYSELLAEMSRDLDVWEEAKALEEGARAALLQRALRKEPVLLILDNVETLPAADRDRLFEFLGRLPRSCKAIVTSRRRADLDARILRLDRLGQKAALKLLSELARDRDLLLRASEVERIAIYEGTGGNPLLIRWVVGQLGRGRCRTIWTALEFLGSAPRDNDPLEFVFGDLVDSFTSTEIQVLGVLCHFTRPAQVKLVSELAELAISATQTALEDLADRSLVMGDAEAHQFALLPLVAGFLKRARPGTAKDSGNRLAAHVYALVVEKGYTKFNGFPELEAQWSAIEAALPLFLQGPNRQLQKVCGALRTFLEFSGRWDEAAFLYQKAEVRALEDGDRKAAGWRAYQRGFLSYRLGQAAQVLACADRVDSHWSNIDVTASEKSYAFRLRGLGLGLENNHSVALELFRQALEISRESGAKEQEILFLNDLANSEKAIGDIAQAEKDYCEALCMAEGTGDSEAVSYITSNLAGLALGRSDWKAAEQLGRQAFEHACTVRRQDLIASSSVRLASALLNLSRIPEALLYARRAVEIYEQIRSPRLNWALGVLQKCQA